MCVPNFLQHLLYSYRIIMSVISNNQSLVMRKSGHIVIIHTDGG